MAAETGVVRVAVVVVREAKNMIMNAAREERNDAGTIAKTLTACAIVVLSYSESIQMSALQSKKIFCSSRFDSLGLAICHFPRSQYQ